VSISEVAVFTKQLSIMMDSGITIVQSLQMLSAQADNPKLKKALEKICTFVESGQELHLAMQKFPDIFDALYTSLVEAGSASGQLDVILKKLSFYVEKSAKLKQQLRSAMTYPVGVIILTTLISAGMIYFVVPMFAANFKESGKPLPGLTQSVVDFSEFMKHYILHVVGLVVGMVIAFKKWKDTPKGHLMWDTSLLKMPVFGIIMKKISIARFASTMSTLTSSGISIIEALNICGRAAGNLAVTKAFNMIKDDVEKGKGLAKPMRKISELFPPMVTGMIEVGETSGKIDQMLAKIADVYEEEVDIAISTMLKLIEPVMFVLIGGIVGFIMIAMYLPIFDMASTQT